MGAPDYLPISFAGGMNEHESPTQIRDDQAQEITNWEPDAQGGLRVRRPWQSASATGGPANPIGRGLGLFTSSDHLLAATKSGALEYQVYRRGYGDLLSGSWTLVDTLTTSVSPTLPVPFATGNGVTLYGSPVAAPVGYDDELHSWNGSAVELGKSPSTILFQCLAFHKDRFFGGLRGSTPNLYWGAVGGDSMATAGDVGYMGVGDTDGEGIKDLAVYLGYLAIGKGNGLWLLTGAGPDTFDLKPLDTPPGCGAAPGRTLVPTPDGLVIVGESRVSMWTDQIRPISGPIESSYGMTGNFMSAGYQDGKVFICDEGSGTIFVWDQALDSWWIEEPGNVDEGPGFVRAKDAHLLAQPRNASINALAIYRDYPGTERGRDANMGETFRAVTKEFYFSGAPGTPQMPKHIWVRFRQLAAGTGQGGISVTLSVEGRERTPQLIETRPVAGTYVERIDVGGSGKSLQITLEQILSDSEEAVIEVEEVVMERTKPERPV